MKWRLSEVLFYVLALLLLAWSFPVYADSSSEDWRLRALKAEAEVIVLKAYNAKKADQILILQAWIDRKYENERREASQGAIKELKEYEDMLKKAPKPDDVEENTEKKGVDPDVKDTQ